MSSHLLKLRLEYRETEFGGENREGNCWAPVVESGVGNLRSSFLERDKHTQKALGMEQTSKFKITGEKQERIRGVKTEDGAYILGNVHETKIQPWYIFQRMWWPLT